MKLAEILANNPIPSTFAGAFFRMARRSSLGRAPANELEASVFHVLDGLSPDVQTVLGCSVNRFEAIPIEDRRRLFGPEFAELVDEPVSVDTLMPMVAAEIIQRASDCIPERPGLRRQTSDNDGVPIFTKFIWSVNGLRTTAFRPAPGEPFDLKPEEIEFDCTVDDQQTPPKLDCQIRTTNCSGQSVGGVCLRVPDVIPGDAVQLEGINFFDVDSRVVLRPLGAGTAFPPVEVDAHVCGDVSTPRVDDITGFRIVDSRVIDRLSFTVPEDLSFGLYSVSVIPNEFPSEQPPIRVVPPPTAVFQIASEKLHCAEETDALIGKLGEDEVAITIRTVEIGRDRDRLLLGPIIKHTFPRFEFDSGDTRDISRVLFQGSNFLAVAISIHAFEVDSEAAFTRMIQDYDDALQLAIEEMWKLIVAGEAAGLGTLVKTLAADAALSTIVIAVVIAVVIAAAIILIYALWAPADLLIEDDNVSLDVVKLGQLTGGTSPLFSSLEGFTSPHGIGVTVIPIEKVATQYREVRMYRNNGQSSTYDITLRYNQLS